MADPREIFQKAVEILNRGRDLKGKKVLVTAGATEEGLDPIRVLTNPSSGRMGIALAEACKRRGGEVVLIHGRVGIPLPEVDQMIQVKTGKEMRVAILKNLLKVDLLLMTAAIADFRPVRARNSMPLPSPQKIKEKGMLTLELERVPDILSEVHRRLKKKASEKRPVIVGFSVETEDGVNRAKRKLVEKGLDLIVANEPRTFGSDEIEATLIGEDGRQEVLPGLTKREAAEKILDQVVKIVNTRQ